MPPRRRALALAGTYVALTLALTWACWGAARLLLKAGAGGALSGALQVIGTLMPAASAYALYPRLAPAGLMPSPAPGSEARDGFWRLALAPGRGRAGWALFAVLFVWRWAMFRLAFGFPATFPDALANAWACLPGILLGGGLEEIGWRGFLQPCLERALSDVRRAGQVRAALLAPLTTGLVWACWHAPLFFMPGAYQQGMAFLPFAGVAVALSYTLAALRSATGGTLACVLAHAWYNAMLTAPVTPGPLPAALFCAEAAACASVLVVKALRAHGSAVPRR